MGPAARSERSGAAIALLLVQFVVGYEWLVSGLTKIVHGDFPTGLADEVAELAQSSSGWYGSFLTGTVVPHATLFAYAVEWAELVAGVALLAGAVAALHLGGRLSPRAGGWLRGAALAGLVVGLVLAVNFELATGGTFGLRLASDSFDEGVSLDTIMVGLQLALLVPLARGLRVGAHAHRERDSHRIAKDLIN